MAIMKGDISQLSIGIQFFTIHSSRRRFMQKSKLILSVFTIFLVTFSAPVFAQMGHMSERGHGMKSSHGEMSHSKSTYDAACWTETLTEEQKAKMAQMRTEYKKKKYLLKAQIKVKKVELATLVTQDKPDQKAIEEKIDEISELIEKKMELKAAFNVSVRAELTPEQRVLFDMGMLKKAFHGKGHGYKK
jgi:Spy/CpxP family protein refolding chaperone